MYQKSSKPIIGKIRRHTSRRLQIRPLQKPTQRDVQGFYRPETGEIYLSTFEKTSVRVLVHEIMHKIFYEQKVIKFPESLKATYAWDNIADEIEVWLFPNARLPWEDAVTRDLEKNYGSNYPSIYRAFKEGKLSGAYKRFLHRSFR